jgi:spore cortex biosynthesis protein YabQ
VNALLLSQFNTVFIFFLTGICIGLLFDFFRIQRKVLKTCDFITYIQDILFWIVSGLIIIFVIMKYTNGEIRIYMVLGIILGILIYFLIISKYIMKIFVCILSFLLNIIGKLLFPIKKIYKIIKKSWKNKNNML